MPPKVNFLELLNAHCLVRSCRVLPKGHIRADTRLLYPDGAAISVFVEQGNLARETGYALSDFGHTFGKLDEFGLNPFQGSRLTAIRDTANDLDIQIMNDRLVLELLYATELQDGVFKLAQACLRASCMIFNRRSSQQPTIVEKVQGVVRAAGLPYEANFNFKGPYNNSVRVDYRVTNPSKSSSVLIMKGSHVQANEVLRRWIDLRRASVADRFLTIYDDQRGVEKREDLQRLNDISELVSVSNPEIIDNLLKAA